MKHLYLFTLLCLYSIVSEAQKAADIVNFAVSVPRYHIAVKRVITRLNPFVSIAVNSRLRYNNQNTAQTITYRNDILSFSNAVNTIELTDTLNIVDLGNLMQWVKGNVVTGTYNRGIFYGTDSCNVNIPVSYNYFDTVAHVQFTNNNFSLDMYVTGIPNTDFSRTLPSNDPIRIIATAKNDIQLSGSIAGYKIEYRWFYKFIDSIATPTAGWTYIPSSDTSALSFSGQTIFGGNYLSEDTLNKTVFIKVEAHVIINHTDSSISSKIEPFTYRLSAPHIINLTPVPVTCFGDVTGGFQVQFDRPLKAGEWLNFLVTDTINYIDYSHLNINSLDASNSYTWQTGLLGGTNYQLALLGKYGPGGSGNYATYTSAPTHIKHFSIVQPPRFDVNVQLQGNVLCKGGNSGEVLLTAFGGTRSYKYSSRFVTDTSVATWAPMGTAGCQPAYCSEIIKGFHAGLYYLKIRDANDCIAKDSFGLEKEIPITFAEPASVLRLDLLQTSPITHSDSSNGSILIKLAGGSPFMEYSLPYEFTWQDSATNAPIVNFSLDTTGGQFETGISNLTGGTYIFTAKDANYNPPYPGINREGCVVTAIIPLPRPAPLQVSLGTKKPNSCFNSNDAVIRAIGVGGVRHTTTGGLPYTYTWYRQNNGVWGVISNTDSLLLDAPPGNYEVRIQDKYNTVAWSGSTTITAPPALSLTYSTVPSSCFSTADGSATVYASGGTGPYYRSYEWSNSQNTETATGLTGGTYVIRVVDTMGCEIIGQVVISSPNQVFTTTTTTPVACFGESNGAIHTSSTGGTGSYTYTWSNGASSSSVSGLPAGRYWVTVADANNCFTVDTITLVAPQPYNVDAGPDLYICTQQRLWLDATVANQNNLQYQWTGPGGYTSFGPRAYVTTPGTYYVTATNASNCGQTDMVVLTPLNAVINTDFVVSTQSFVNENLLLVNLSHPTPDSVKWILPATGAIQLINQNRNYCELKFSDTGAFYITMKAFYPGGCIDDTTKKIIITTKNGFTNLGNQADAFLKSFSVYPNPNTGLFYADMAFNATTKARLRLVNTLTNLVVNDRTVEGSLSYHIEYTLASSIPAGPYVLVIETAKGSFIHTVIVQ